MLMLSFPVSGLTPYAVAGCHPLTAFGVPVILLFNPGFRDFVAPPRAKGCRPTGLQISLATLANKLQFTKLWDTCEISPR